MNGSNNSPFFNTHPVFQPSINEDDIDNDGMSVYIMAFHLLEDDDIGAVRGIAITDVDSSKGQWEYSLPDPCRVTWIPIPANISTATAIVLRATVQNFVRFVPERDYNGIAQIAFLAWDATDSLEDGSTTNASSPTTTAPFSNESRVISVRVLPQNDAPLLNSLVEPRMTNISENSPILNPIEGDNVTLFISALKIDVDIFPSTNIGIAIVEVDSSNGVWQFTTDGGMNWTNISRPLEESNALVLYSQPEGMNRVRFHPNKDFNGESSFRYKLWDLTSGHTSGDSNVDTRTDPVTGAFSVDSTTAHITVDPLNSAPVITGLVHRYGSILEDLSDGSGYYGAHIRSIAAPVYKDADNAIDTDFGGLTDGLVCHYRCTRGGVAIVEVSTENGHWEYRFGNKWVLVPNVSESSALLLDAVINPRIRFIPHKDFFGEVSFRFKLWDRSDNLQHGTLNANTSTGPNPLTGAYSIHTATAILNVLPVNDNPILQKDASLDPILEDIDTTTNFGTTVERLLDSASYDVDGPSVGVTIIGIDERFGSWEYNCENTSTWLNFDNGAPRVSEATLILGHCRVRFLPKPDFNSEFDEDGFPRPDTDFPYMLIRAWDGYGSVYKNLQIDVDTRVDVDNTFSKEIGYARIVVEAVNDPPILFLGVNKSFESTYKEPPPPRREVEPVLLVDPIWMKIQDVDNALLSNVTFSFMRYDGMQEFLTVDTTDTELDFIVTTNSSSEYKAVLLAKTSTSSVIEDYRRALSTTRYQNYAEEPNPHDRHITFTLSDDGLGGEQTRTDTAISTVHISLVNDPPELDLDSDTPGRSSHVHYVEGDPPILLLGLNHSLIDHDSINISEAIVTIISPPDEENEILGVNTENTSIIVDHNGGRIRLLGPETSDEFSLVLSTVSYTNVLARPGNPSNKTREIKFTVKDDRGSSTSSSAFVTFIPVNDPPEVDANGGGQGIDGNAVFIEDDSRPMTPQNIDRNNILEVIDIDNDNLEHLDVTIENALDGNLERLSITFGTEVIGDSTSNNYFIRIFRADWIYFQSNSSLHMTGLGSVLEYQQVLRTLTYSNTAEEPLNTTRNISIVAYDGELYSETAYVFLKIQNINDSPFFNNAIDVISPSIYEDIRLDENHGYSLDEVAGDLILDNDRDSVKGIAIISADSRYGRWEYTVDFTNVTYVVEYPETNATNTTDYSGSVNDSESLFVFDANWTPLSEVVSITEAVVLRVNGTTTRLRFVPNKDFNGEANLMFVAWDASDGLKDGSITDASDQSDTDPFSSDYRNLIVTVNKTNDAPLLSPISFNLSSILEDDVSSEGDPVEDLLSGISDVDIVDEEYGIAVTVVDERYGTWQFSVDSGDNWTPMKNVSMRSAVLLRSSPPGVNRVRFVPVLDFNGFSTLTFVGWDLTSGEPSGTTGVDVLLSDPVSGPFSRNKTTAMIFVEQVNDSPSLGDGSSLFTILEDLPVMDNNGTSVGEIVNGTFYDVDDVPDLNFAPFTDVGIVVVGVDLRYGEWQYWCPNRNEWEVFIGDFILEEYFPLHPTVERATLLLSDCRIRFLPNLHFNTLKDLNGDFRPESDVPFITIRGWDNTGPSADKSGMYGQDTTYNNDSHLNEFSFETSKATISIASVNDIPLLNISSSDKGVVFRTEFVEDSPFVRVTDPPYVRLVDIDNARLESVTISVVNSLDPDSELIDIVDDSPIIEVNGSTVAVTLNTVHRFQIMYSIYSNDSSVSQSSLMIMSVPGHESVAIEVYEELLRHVVYKNLHPEPTNGTREIVFVVDDGEDVNNRNRAFVDVTLRAENRPVFVPNKMIVFFTEGDLSPIPLTSPLLTLTDRDHNEYFYISGATLTFGIVPRSPLEYLSVDLSVVDPPFSLVQNYSTESGTLTVRGEAPVSQYQEVLRSVLYHNTEGEPRPGHQPVSIQVTDTHNLTSQPVSIVVEITVVNDNPPEISAPTQPYKYVEGSSYALLHNIFISDNDTGGGDLYIYQVNATIMNPMDLEDEELGADRSPNVDVMFDDDYTLILTGPASVSDFQNVLSTLRYLNRAEEPNTDIRIIELVAKDANFTSDLVSIFVNISLMNDLPVVDLNGPHSPDVDIAVNYVEGSGPQPIVDPFNLTVHDNDHNYLVWVIVELTNPYDSPLEFLSVNSTVSNISSDYNVSSAVLTLSGRSSLEDYQSILRSVTYENKEALPGLPNTTVRIVTFVAFDGDAYSMTSTAMVMFDSVNDPPLFDLNGEDRGRDYCTSFTEEGPPILLSSRDMTLIDVDNTSLESVTVRITNLHDGDREVLTLSGDFYYKFPTASVDYSSGVLTVSGLGEVSHFREAALSVQYWNLADEPNFEPRIVEFVANDGLLDSLSSFTTIDMIAVNDFPRMQIEKCTNFSCCNDSSGFLDSNSSNSTIQEDNASPVDNQTETQSLCNSTVVNATCSPGSASQLNSTAVSNTTAPLHHLVHRRSTLGWDLIGFQNVTNGTILYDPAPFSTEYVENSPPVPITNPYVVLIEDDDDTMVQFSLTTTGILDSGFESVFFHSKFVTDSLKVKLEPYTSMGCPYDSNTFTTFNLTANFTLDEMTEAVKALFYCNYDEFSTSGTRTVAMYITDPHDGRSDTQMAFIDVIAVNDEPLLLDYLMTAVIIDEDGNYTLPALSYFFDHEENLTGSAIQILLIDPEVGEATVDEESGDVVYSSALNDYGVRTVWYQACDSQEACSSPVNLTIIINPVNDPPSFGITNLTVLEDTVVSLALPQDLNVTDPEDVLNSDSFTVVTGPQVGKLEYTGGTLVYTPPEHYNTPTSGSPITFTLQVCDNDTENQLCTNQSLSITYLAVNDAPLLPPIPVVIYEDNPYVSDLTSLISDVEESVVASDRIMLLDPLPQHGTVAYNDSTGILRYQPNHNYHGSDAIYFQACDAVGLCNFSGIVNLTILAVNDPPQAEMFTAYLFEDQHNVFSFCSYVGDVDIFSSLTNTTTPSHINEFLRLHIVDPASGELVDRLISPNNATLRVFEAHGIIGYDPMMEFVGMDSFTYAVCDLCHIARNGELGRVELPPECLKQIEESGGGQLSIDNRNITCVERKVRVVVRNVDDVPVVSDISALVPVGESVTVSPFNESRVSSQHSLDGYLYTDPNTPVFEQDDLQLTLAADMGHNLTELLLNTDSDVDESSLRVFSPPSNGNVTVERNDQYPHFVYSPNVDFQGYDTFEYEVCDKIINNRHLTTCTDTIFVSSTIHCSKATVRIFVFGEGPTISSVVAVSSKVTRSGETLDFDSKVSRGDKILINFAVPTNMPPYGEANCTVTREDIDRIFEFDSPFISDQIAPAGYEGRWIDNSLFELEIVDEGYPQPEVPIGEWRVRVANGVGPCGGFDPVTRRPVDSSVYCLQDAKGTSFHSTAVSNPITGNFGLKIPKISYVKIIPDTPSKKVELTKDIFLNTQIVIYLKEPLSHYQLELYCQKEAHFLLNPALIDPNAKLTLTGCQNLLSNTENAAVRYSNNIAIYEGLYLSKRKRSTEEDNSRSKRQAGLTELPLYSEITFKVVDLSSTSTMAVDPGMFVDEVKRNFNYTALADVISSTSGVPVSEYATNAHTPTLSTRLQHEHYDSTTPKIVSVGCTSEDDFFNAGDRLTITFDRLTDTPPVSTRYEIDRIFKFDPSIGTNYTGVWLNMKTVQITIVAGNREEISSRAFTVGFTPTYLDEGTPLLPGNTKFPAQNPWCVGINVCGVQFSSLSVGVCDNYSLSCRAFKPWTGAVVTEEEELDLLLIIAPILAFIIVVILCGVVSRPLYKYTRKLRSRYKAHELDKWFWNRFDDIATVNHNFDNQSGNEIQSSSVDSWILIQDRHEKRGATYGNEGQSRNQNPCRNGTESGDRRNQIGNRDSCDNIESEGQIRSQDLNKNGSDKAEGDGQIRNCNREIKGSSDTSEIPPNWSSPSHPQRSADPFVLHQCHH